MINDRTASVFSEDGSDLYPHLKITAEEFPRIFATRRIEDDGAEYFGAFLTKTAVRILIDFLNRTFRLRSCDIEIDGNFPVPCTQYYRKRCLGPCVDSLCDRESYLGMVGLARLFLSNQRGLLMGELDRRIDQDAEDLEFESAAAWRDILIAVEHFWQNPRWQVWLDDTTDTYVTDETVAGDFIYLATQRGRHILGRKVFQLPRGGGISPDESLERIIESFYRFHLPKEIRVSIDFENRKAIADELSKRFGRLAKIVVVRPDKNLVMSIRALRTARAENELDFVKAKATPRQISGELKRLFGLKNLPKRVEAFDVGHISGTSFVAASSVWENGRFITEEYLILISDPSFPKTELQAMSDAVLSRLSHPWLPNPDIILIDGGRSQINAVRSAWKKTDSVDAPFIGAVKPPGQHSSVSYFISETGEKTKFNAYNPAHVMLQLLRDAAHDLANRAHRDLRDMVHHYELSALLPSITEPGRRTLMAHAGSIKKIRELPDHDLQKIVGHEAATLIASDLKKDRS
ncbi:MAG: hypothetical protein ABIO36_06045, partial [Pyrinomonadaceae bacterium]